MKKILLPLVVLAGLGYLFFKSKKEAEKTTTKVPTWKDVTPTLVRGGYTETLKPPTNVS